MKYFIKPKTFQADVQSLINFADHYHFDLDTFIEKLLAEVSKLKED